MGCLAVNVRMGLQRSAVLKCPPCSDIPPAGQWARLGGWRRASRSRSWWRRRGRCCRPQPPARRRPAHRRAPPRTCRSCSSSCPCLGEWPRSREWEAIQFLEAQEWISFGWAGFFKSMFVFKGNKTGLKKMILQKKVNFHECTEFGPDRTAQLTFSQILPKNCMSENKGPEHTERPKQQARPTWNRHHQQANP